MKLSILLTAILLLPQSASFQWVSFNMVKRTLSGGKTTRVETRVYHRPNGETVTFFTYPEGLVVMNNAFGDLRIYNTRENSVVRSLDNRMSSHFTTFHYFLTGKTEDMGLKASGFQLKDSRIEDKMLVSDWEATFSAQGQVKWVELVSDGSNPVFMGYKDQKGTYLKKVYFYDYDFTDRVEFPFSITEIDFVGKDSVVSKTTFSNFRFDSPEDESMVQYEIPSNAKVIE